MLSELPFLLFLFVWLLFTESEHKTSFLLVHNQNPMLSVVVLEGQGNYPVVR